MKFALGFMAGTVAGAVLMGQAMATIWKQGRWKEYVEEVDTKLSIKHSKPKQLNGSLADSYSRTQTRWNQHPL